MTEKKQLDQLRDIVRSNNLIAENTQRNAKLVERIESILYQAQLGSMSFHIFCMSYSAFGGAGL